MSDSSKRPDIWNLLRAGKQFQLSDLPTRDGRLLLESLRSPAPTSRSREKAGDFELERLGGLTKIQDVQWKAVHFSRCDLRHLRFSNVKFENCVFEDANCMDWRLWNSDLMDVEFTRCNMKDAVLGGSAEAGFNSYRRVIFDRCELRRTSHVASSFADCEFRNCGLECVDFSGSRFTRCSFQGLLDRVEFYASTSLAPRTPPNEMDGVDFREAELRGVDFRGLSLRSVLFPADEKHIVLDRNARVTLTAMLDRLARYDSSSAVRVLIADLGHVLQNLGPDDGRAIFHRDDIRSFSGADGLRLFETVLAEVESDASA